jgi:beta-lactamase class A
MQRRQFNSMLAGSLATAMPIACAVVPAHATQKNLEQAPDPSWAAIEAESGGRLGIAVLDTATGRFDGHRLGERFPMCSTFKWLAAALALQRVDAGLERLDRRVAVRREMLVSHSPVSERHVGGNGMSIAELCEAAVLVSDNAAANLLLASFGGPAAITRYARTLGDTQTRLDRTEPALNEARPGDPRDTTTPRSMAIALQSALLGTALSEASRARLVAWMEAVRTGTDRLRDGLPPDWRVADKTGTGARGTTNDVAVVWPPNRAPLVITAYLTDSQADAKRLNAALAAVAHEAAARVA